MAFSGNPTTDIDFELEFQFDDFFPEINVKAFIGEHRISDEYREEVIHRKLKQAIIDTNESLMDWKLEKQTDNDFEWSEEKEFQYKNAIGAKAKADLMSDYASMNRRAEQVNSGKESIDQISELMNEHQKNLNAIQDYRGTVSFGEI